MGRKRGMSKNPDCGSNFEKGETRDIVGSKIGMSGKQYSRAKYIAVHATPDIIDELDRGKRTIRRTYDELRAKEKNKFRPEKQIKIPE
jgi:hypothetical protein